MVDLLRPVTVRRVDGGAILGREVDELERPSRGAVLRRRRARPRTTRPWVSDRGARPGRSNSTISISPTSNSRSERRNAPAARDVGRSEPDRPAHLLAASETITGTSRSSRGVLARVAPDGLRLTGAAPPPASERTSTETRAPGATSGTRTRVRRATSTDTPTRRRRWPRRVARRRWTSSARGTVSSASVEALARDRAGDRDRRAERAQLDERAGRAGERQRQSPSLRVDRASRDAGAAPLTAEQRGAAPGRPARRPAARTSAAYTLTRSGSEVDRLRAGLGDHAAHHAADVGEDARERAQQRARRGGAEADADAARAPRDRSTRRAATSALVDQVDVAQHAPRSGAAAASGSTIPSTSGASGPAGGGAEAQHRHRRLALPPAPRRSGPTAPRTSRWRRRLRVRRPSPAVARGHEAHGRRAGAATSATKTASGGS